MDLLLFDKSLVPFGAIDTHISCLWTENFIGKGSLELKLPMGGEVYDLIKQARWISHPLSNNLMELYAKGIDTSEDSGDILTVKGYSLEGILGQRTIYSPLAFNTTLSTITNQLLDSNFISPTDATRKYPLLTRKAAYSSSKAATFVVKTSRKKLAVDTILEDFLLAAKVGYRVTLNADRTGFEFDLYDGSDYSSIDSPGYIEFSRDFDNLGESKYSENDETRFTKAWLDGRVGSTDVTTVINTGATGIDMRESYISASGVESKTATGADMTAAAFKAALTAYGQKQYALNYTKREYSCTVDFGLGYEYGTDYVLGDLVMVKDPYGYSEKSRVSAVAFSSDTSKVTVVPSFEPDEDHTITEQQ